jgi:aspartate/methionine/tyrosine aminotransferase
MDRLGTETAFEVLARAQALERQGRHIIHLEIGEPDFPSPTSAIEAAIDALRSGVTKYTTSPGLLDLRSRIAEIEGPRRGLKLTPDQVVVTPGGKPIMFYTILALVEEGDEVLYPDPGFPIYQSMVDFAGGRAVPYPLREANGFRIDLDTIASRLKPTTRLVILNSPNNPTGGVETAETLRALAELLRGRDTWVLSDEIYSHFIYEGRHASVGSFGDLTDRLVILDGFSKSFSMTGWRLGWGIMPPELATQVVKLVVNSVSCTPPFSQRGALAALETREITIPPMIAEFRRRREAVVDLLNRIPGVRCAAPGGAFYVFPNVRSFGRSSKEIADYLLTEGGVACLPGTSFGREGEGYLRFSFATAMDKLEQGVARVAEALGALAPVS